MQEKSPFTFRDLFKQRKRWMQGIYMVCTSPLIPIQSKLILSISLGIVVVFPPIGIIYLDNLHLQAGLQKAGSQHIMQIRIQTLR
jgi:hypothetical protein